MLITVGHLHSVTTTMRHPIPEVILMTQDFTEIEVAGQAMDQGGYLDLDAHTVHMVLDLDRLHVTKDDERECFVQ